MLFLASPSLLVSYRSIFISCNGIVSCGGAEKVCDIRIPVDVMRWKRGRGSERDVEFRDG